jgi:hypothetical protein
MKEAIEIKDREDIKSIKLARWKGHYKMGFVREEMEIINTSRLTPANRHHEHKPSADMTICWPSECILDEQLLVSNVWIWEVGNSFEERKESI